MPLRADELQQRLNTDANLRQRFAADPKAVIEEFGGTLSDQQADAIKKSAQNATAGNANAAVMPLPIIIR